MTDLEDKAVWKPCFSVDGVELPTGYHFGFSAATGDLSDNHEILAVRLYEVDSDDPVSILFHYFVKYDLVLGFVHYSIFLIICKMLVCRLISS